MQDYDFPELQRILVHRSKIHKLYWIAAILFWSGFFVASSYYISQTGTIPSMFAGVLMISGAGLYIFVRLIIKPDS